jgi:hypothetical protein
MGKKDTCVSTVHLPLWRLLVALADAERNFGAADPRTKAFADAVRKRLADEPSPRKGDGDAD